MNPLTLYSYWRSSASYRIRIALELKQLDYQLKPVNIVKAEHRENSYLLMNPQGLLPCLQDGKQTINQSMAILEYLEDVYTDKPLLPDDHTLRAHIRTFCQVIACEAHPLNNLSVLNYLRDELSVDDEKRQQWYQHWVKRAFSSLELLCTDDTLYAYGNEPSLAECFLLPQMYNARRFNCDLSDFPRLVAIEKACLTLDAFKKAYPDNQIDAKK